MIKTVFRLCSHSVSFLLCKKLVRKALPKLVKYFPLFTFFIITSFASSVYSQRCPFLKSIWVDGLCESRRGGELAVYGFDDALYTFPGTFNDIYFFCKCHYDSKDWYNTCLNVVFADICNDNYYKIDSITSSDSYDYGPPTGLVTFTRNYYVYKYSSCSLKINSYMSSRTIIDPSMGETATFLGSVNEASGSQAKWSIKITDSSGASWKTFSGTGNSPSVVWDGKDSFAKIVDDGLYTATLEVETEDGKCKDTASAQLTVKSSCRVSDITVSPSWVFPQQTGGTITKSTISVILAAPAPSAGCTFKFGVEPVDYTGGHMHAGGRPTGSLSSETIIIPAMETGPKTVKYTSGEVAGTERIVAALLDSNGNATSWRELPIEVKVPILGPLGDGGGWWRLTGQTDSHIDNHYAEPYTAQATPYIAIEYYQKTEMTLGINDISLEWGGLFDVGPQGGAFWSTPHESHRRGTGVDIDRKAYDPEEGEFIEVLCNSDKILKKIINKYTAKLICEEGGKKHIQFY